MALEFKSGDMTRITGVKLARLQQWWAAGYIGPPSVSVAEGAGTRNVFSISDLFRIMFFKRCIDSGIPREHIRKFLLFDERFRDTLTKGLEVDLETYKREGPHKRPRPGVSEMYAVYYRKGNEVIKFTALTATSGELSVPKEFSEADDFIGFNIGKIIEELCKNIAG